MKNQDENQEIDKGKSHIIVEIIQYVPNALLTKMIIKKTTGNVTVSSLDAGVELEEKQSSFDTYVQIIDGSAELTIDKNIIHLKRGEGIVIPAHSKHKINAKEQFKMVSTTIKSGYEGLV